MADQPPRMSVAGLGTGGLITAAAIGVLGQRCPDFLDFSRNVLDIAPLGIIVIAIGGAIGEGIRRLFSKPASVEPEASTPQQREQYHA